MNAPALPDRPVGRRLAYYLECIATGGEGLTEADRDRFQESPNPSFDPISPETWQRLKKQLGDFQLAGLEDKAECKLVAILDGGGKRWEMSFEVAEEPPHRIGRVMIQRALDPDVTVRKATAADAPALAEIERGCPIQLGDTAITYDRGDDYFAFARLMEDVTVGLAFDAGVPAAINCCAVHSVRIGGVEQRVKTAIHTRVLPAHQRKGLWGAVNRVLNESYPDGSYACSRAYVSIDNAAMQLIRNPARFDVIVSENTFGDILTDEASVLSGSMGMLPSASVAGVPGQSKRLGPALYEPIHGTAPDIAGQGIANPIGTVLSVAMMLRYSFSLEEEASAVEASVDGLLAEGYRTPDIASGGGDVITTSEMGAVIAAQI